ncbi:hypothetical protein ACJDT4_18905 [Clostridium neuense]|uniref:Uncharacterized protein n=1 Tax=Clostridium neuense TaxID=1728934 RepID=A0ABW8TLT4_9CLOT
MEYENKEKVIEELKDEIDVVLSIKDEITEDEINNFKEEFPMLTETEIRKEISKLTQNEKYIEQNSEEIDDVKEYKIGKKRNSEDQENADLDDTIRIDSIKIKDAISNIKSEENLNEDIKPKEIKEPEVEYIEPGRLPENIKVIRGEVKYNQLSIDWDWPYGVNRMLVLYRNDKFPTKADDSSAVKIIVDKSYGEAVGQFIIHKVKEENYYFCVFPVLEVNGEVTYLEGKKRLVVSKAPSEVFYRLKVKKSLFGSVKAVSVLFSTSAEEINMPPTVLVSKKASIPVLKSDGEEIYKFDYIKLSKDETAEVEVPVDLIRKNTYIKLFFDDERNGSMFRIIPPEKRELYFK